MATVNQPMPHGMSRRARGVSSELDASPNAALIAGGLRGIMAGMLAGLIWAIGIAAGAWPLETEMLGAASTGLIASCALGGGLGWLAAALSASDPITGVPGSLRAF